MKKTIIFFTCMLFQLCVHAQLKVTADGKTYIQHEYTDGLSSLSVGESNLIEYQFLGDMAIHAHKYWPYWKKVRYGYVTYMDLYPL